MGWRIDEGSPGNTATMPINYGDQPGDQAPTEPAEPNQPGQPGQPNQPGQPAPNQPPPQRPQQRR